MLWAKVDDDAYFKANGQRQVEFEIFNPSEWRKWRSEAMNKRKNKFNLNASPFYMQLIALAVARTQYQTHLTKSKHARGIHKP